MKKYLPLLWVITLAAVLPLCGQAGKPDFSGTWTLDRDKSELGSGGGGRMAATTVVIEHKDPQLTIKRTIQTQSGDERVIEAKYTTDGKTNTNETARGSVESKTIWEGSKIVTDSTRQTQNGTMEIRETYSFSADGKTLTIQNAVKDGSRPARTLVYTKK
jgi:hypothetical protein